MSTIDEIRARFEEDTQLHEMRVLKDDGLYRHIRFARPGSSVYLYDLVTWPGYLAIVGDAGDYVFRRVSDMFDFFKDEGYGISPDYWAGKLEAPRPAVVSVFSPDALRRQVIDWFDRFCEDEEPSTYDRFELSRALESDVLDENRDGSSAHAALREFEHVLSNGSVLLIHDPWEWDLDGFDQRFLWCCWAIQRGIARYTSERPAVTS